jgi:hypothetical protein
LTKLAQALRKAGGIAEPPPTVQPALLTPGANGAQQPQAPASPGQAPAAVPPSAAPQIQPGTKPDAKPETKTDAKSDKRAANGTENSAQGSLEPSSAQGRTTAAKPKPADAATPPQKAQESARRGN